MERLIGNIIMGERLWMGLIMVMALIGPVHASEESDRAALSVVITLVCLTVIAVVWYTIRTQTPMRYGQASALMDR